jgi:bifunctional non-homologous end joining protein LigD
MSTQIAEVGGHDLKLSNPDKVLFPAAGLTKADLIDYYERIAPVILPHLAGRPLSLVRYPNGIEVEGFMQKNASDYFPSWIRRARLAKQDGDVAHVVADSAATLVYLANQACVTLHAGLARTDRIDHPDFMVFDFDPSDDDFGKVKRAARDARALLDEVGLTSFVQTTGSRGLHVWVPLDRAAPFDEVREIASNLADALVARAPDERTTAQRKANRGDRVFIDIARNAYGQTVVAPYSVRARPEASVATPLHWDELNSPDLKPRHYTVQNVFRRLGQKPDPWAGIEQHAQTLTRVREKLAALVG